MATVARPGLGEPQGWARGWRAGAAGAQDAGIETSRRAPEYLDRLAVRAMGFKRQDADRIFRALPVVSLPGARKCYVRRADLEALLSDHTYRGDRVRPLQ